MDDLPLTLYRVGEPSIGEAWPRRFNSSRSTGGLGTGVYAFRDRSAANRNIEDTSPDKELFEMRDILSNPIQPRTWDATEALVRLSRIMGMLTSQVEVGEITYDRAAERAEILGYSLTDGFTSSKGFGRDKPSTVGDPARQAVFNTPELRSKYGYDTGEFIADFVRAAETAHRRLDSDWDETGIQPINVLLWPEYDGVAPLEGAGGNNGKHGCVVFKQKIDNCVGHETESFDEIDVATLNGCFEE